MRTKEDIKKEIDFLRRQRKIYENGNDRFYQTIRSQFDSQISTLQWVLCEDY